MIDIFLTSAILASFLAGMVALFAPCCISVMLPAYFASTFATRRALVAMTFVFAAGLATVILPIALGAAAVGSLINANHTAFYLAGGALMLALGLYMIVGGKLMLPMPGFQARSGRGPLAVYSLGLFSGVASSCCAPVLAGVVALAGVSGSFSAAVVLGVAYVFGMVFPLFVISLLWDRFNWGESRLLKGKRFTVRAFGRELVLHSTALASGLILIAMAGVVFAIAARGNVMPSSGWQLTLSARIQHYASVVKDWAGIAPGWVSATALSIVLALLISTAVGQALRLRQASAPPDSPAPGPGSPSARGRDSAKVAAGRPREDLP